MPYMREPNYWDSDLGIYKSFHITESQSIQFKASATNWLNHPLGQFGLAGNGDKSLNSPADSQRCDVHSADQHQCADQRCSGIQNRLPFCHSRAEVLLLNERLLYY